MNRDNFCNNLYSFVFIITSFAITFYHGKEEVSQINARQTF